MIDDTGPRITALERRVAEIEARLLGMERVDAAIANNVLALTNYIEQARAARSDIRSAGAPVTVYPGEGIEVTVRGGGGAAREDQTTGGGGKLHPRDSSSRNHAEASEVLGSNPSPPTTYAAQRLIAAALAAADTWTDANQSYRVPLMDAAKAYRAARQAQPIPAANSSDAPTLAEAMEGLRRFYNSDEPSEHCNCLESIEAAIDAWDACDTAKEWARMRADRDTWKARAEQYATWLRQIEPEADMDPSLRNEIRAHLKGTP